jgi:hypothetical protein
MDDRGKPVSDWRLERLAQGELDEAAVRELEGKLGKEALEARLAALRASDQEILARLPPDVVGAAVRARAAAGRRRRHFVPLLAALGMTAAALVLVPRLAGDERGIAGGDPAADPGGLEPTGIKGDARLLAYLARANGSTPALRHGSRVRPRDVVQLKYQAGTARFGAVLSIDGRGAVTVHLPPDAARPVALVGDGAVNLPQSYELDDAPGFERFIFVTSANAFSLPEVLEAARALARAPGQARHKPLELPAELQQQSLLLEKVQP